MSSNRPTVSSSASSSSPSSALPKGGTMRQGRHAETDGNTDAIANVSIQERTSGSRKRTGALPTATAHGGGYAESDLDIDDVDDHNNAFDDYDHGGGGTQPATVGVGATYLKTHHRHQTSASSPFSPTLRTRAADPIAHSSYNFTNEEMMARDDADGDNDDEDYFTSHPPPMAHTDAAAMAMLGEAVKKQHYAERERHRQAMEGPNRSNRNNSNGGSISGDDDERHAMKKAPAQKKRPMKGKLSSSSSGSDTDGNAESFPSSSSSSSNASSDSLLGGGTHNASPNPRQVHKHKDGPSSSTHNDAPHYSILRGPLLPASLERDDNPFREKGDAVDDDMSEEEEDGSSNESDSPSNPHRYTNNAHLRSRRKLAKTYNTIPIVTPLPPFLEPQNNYRDGDDDDSSSDDANDTTATDAARRRKNAVSSSEEEDSDDDDDTFLSNTNKKRRMANGQRRRGGGRGAGETCRVLGEHALTVLLRHNIEHCPTFSIYSNLSEVSQAAHAMEKRGMNDPTNPSTYSFNALPVVGGGSGSGGKAPPSSSSESNGGGDDKSSSGSDKGVWVRNFFVDVCFTKKTTLYTTDSVEARSNKMRNVWVVNERGWPGYDYKRCVADALIFRNRSNLPIRRNADGTSVSASAYASGSHSASVNIRKGGGAKGADGKEALSGSVITNSRDTLLPLIAITYLYGTDEKIPTSMLTGEWRPDGPRNRAERANQPVNNNNNATTANNSNANMMLASERGRDTFTYINKGNRYEGSLLCDEPSRSIGVFPNNRMCTSHLHEALVGGVGESTMPAMVMPPPPPVYRNQLPNSAKQNFRDPNVMGGGGGGRYASGYEKQQQQQQQQPLQYKPRHFVALRYLPSLCRAEDLFLNEGDDMLNFVTPGQSSTALGGSGHGGVDSTTNNNNGEADDATMAAAASLVSGLVNSKAADLEESRTFFGQFFRPANPTALKKIIHPAAAKNLAQCPQGSNGNGNGATLQDPAAGGVRSLASSHRRNGHPFYKMRQVLGFDLSCMLTHATNMGAPDPVDDEQLLLIECPSKAAKDLLLARIQRALVSFYTALRRFHASNNEDNPNPFATSVVGKQRCQQEQLRRRASSVGGNGGGGVLRAPTLRRGSGELSGGEEDALNSSGGGSRGGRPSPPSANRLYFGSVSPNGFGGIGRKRRAFSASPSHRSSKQATRALMSRMLGDDDDDDDDGENHNNNNSFATRSGDNSTAAADFFAGAGYGVMDESVCLEACLQRTFHMHYMRRLFFHCADKNRSAFITAISKITKSKGLGIRRIEDEEAQQRGGVGGHGYNSNSLPRSQGGGKSSIAAQTAAAAAAAAAAAKEQQLAAQAALSIDPKKLKAIDSIDEAKDDEVAILQKLLKSPPYKDSGIEGVFNYLMLKARTFVSLKKRRFTAESFNLDLAYIRPDMIAMGYPSVGKEALYRNPMQETIRFLETYHNPSGASYPVSLTSLLLGLELLHGASGIPTSCPYNPMLETFAIPNKSGDGGNSAAPSSSTSSPAGGGGGSVYGFGVLSPLTRGVANLAGLDTERDTMRSCALMLPYPSASQRLNDSATRQQQQQQQNGNDSTEDGGKSKKKKKDGGGESGGGGGGLASLFASKTVQMWQDEHRRRVLDTYSSLERFMYHDAVAISRAMCNNHVPNYRIFNLCSERCYAPSRFAGSFERFPADDHHPAPFNTLVSFCVSAASFLAGGDGSVVPLAELEEVLPVGMPSSERMHLGKGGDGGISGAAVAALSRVGGAITGALSTLAFSSLLSRKHGNLQFLPIDPFLVDASAMQRVVAIHCKAGKGRTGAMCVALMLFLGQFERGSGGRSPSVMMSSTFNNNAPVTSGVTATAKASSTAHALFLATNRSLLLDKRLHPLIRALNWYGITRTHNNKGVSIASQLQFLEYLNWYLESERHRLATLFATSQHPADKGLVEQFPKLACPVNFPIHYVPHLLRAPPCPTALLRSISFTPYPCLDLDGKCKPYFIILCRRPNHTHYPIGQQEHVSVEADTLRPIYDSRLGWLAQRPHLRSEVTPNGVEVRAGGGNGSGGGKSGSSLSVRVVEKTTISAIDSNTTFGAHQRHGAASAAAAAAEHASDTARRGAAPRNSSAVASELGNNSGGASTVLPPGVDPTTTAYFPLRGFEIVGEVRFVFYAEQRTNSLLFGTNDGGGGKQGVSNKDTALKGGKSRDQYLFSFWIHTGFMQQQARASRIEVYTPEGKFSHTDSADELVAEENSQLKNGGGSPATASPPATNNGGVGGGGLSRLSRFAHLADSIDCPDLHATARSGSGGVVRLRKEQLDGASKKNSKLFDSGFTCSIEFTLM